ncbi:MAG: urea transport system permease protein, partial [Paracoccaceae bacterium]
MRHILAAITALLFLALPVAAQTGPVQSLLQDNRAMIEKSSRKTIQPTVDNLAASGLPQVQLILQKWQAREILQRKEDKLFFYGTETEKNVYRLFDFDTAEPVGEYPKKQLKQIKPNSGVQAMIATSLVKFQLSDPDMGIGWCWVRFFQ